MAVTARVTRGENGLMKGPHSFHHDGYDNLFRDKRSQGEKSIKTYRTDWSEDVCFRKSYKTCYIIAKGEFHNCSQCFP